MFFPYNFFLEVSTISNTSGLDGHIMISYNRSVTAMCLKLRDRLKVGSGFFGIAIGWNLIRLCIIMYGWMWIISMEEF